MVRTLRKTFIPNAFAAKRSAKVFRQLFVMLALILCFTQAHAQINFTGEYTQNFNTYAGTTASLPTGWTYAGNPITQNGVGTGTSSTGGIYAFGTGGEVSLGYLHSGSTTPVGSYTATFKNVTGVTITSLSISYNFEQWRYGTSNTSGISSVTVNGTSVPALVQAGVATGTNGSVTSTPKSATVSVSIANNATYTIVWQFNDLSGSENGIGIDDFKMCVPGNAFVVAPTSNSPVVAPAALTLSVTPTGGTAAYTYNWQGPSTFSSVIQNPSISSTSVANSGTYTVIVTDAVSCTSSGTTSVTVTAGGGCTGTPPGGSVSPSSAVVCNSGNQLFALTGGSGSSGITYQWSSNTTNTPPGTDISGATNATYTPSVTATTYYWCTSTCAAASTSAISAVGLATVVASPTVAPISGSSSVFLLGTTTLSDATGSGVWSSANTAVGSVSTGGVVRGLALGTTTISYTVTNGAGCIGVAAQVETVTPSVADFSGEYTQNFNSFAGTFITLPTGWTFSGNPLNEGGQADGSGSSGGEFAFGSGSDWDLGYLHTGSVTPVGAYTATFKNTTGATITSLSVAYNFEQWRASNTSGIASVTVGGISAPTLAQAGSASATGTTPKSATVSGLSIANNAQFTVVFQFDDASGSDNPVGIDDYVMCVPGKAFTATPSSNSPVTAPAALTFSVTPTGGTSAYTYKWTGPGTFTSSTAQNPIIPSTTVGNSGTYSLTVTDAVACTSTSTLSATVSPGTSCSGTPAAGTATVSASSVCGSGTSNVTLSGAEVGAGINYQWYSSSDGSIYNPISGATASIYTATVSATTFYQCTTTCTVTSSSATSTAVTVTVNALPTVAAITGGSSVLLGANLSLTDATTGVTSTWTSTNTGIASVGSATGVVTGLATGSTTISYSVTNSFGCSGVATQSVTVTYPYCGTTVSGSNDKIGIVTAGGSANITTYVPTASPEYVNKVATLGVAATPGTVITYTVTSGTGFPGTSSIWVDWTQSGAFADSTSEQEMTSVALAASGSSSSSFTVPLTARGGFTVMRLGFGESPATYGTAPCGTGSFGNVVDFYFKVLPGISSNPVSTAVSEGASASFNATVLAASSYQWQRGISGSYTNIDNTTDGGVYSGYNTNTLLISSTVAGMDGYTYKVIATNPAGSATSTAATLTVNIVPACSGTPNAGTASPSITSACGSTSSVLTLNGGSANTGLTYQWSSSSTNTPPGTDISGATSSVYNATGITSTTYYWCTTTCVASSASNISSVGTVIITQIPTVIVTPAGGNYCSATSGLSMTASGATTYIWAPSTGLSATTGATVLANSTTSVTYTVTGTTAGCAGANTATVNYFTTPSPTVTPTFINACIGGTTNLLTANVGAGSPANASSGTVNLTGAASPTATATSPVTVSGIPSGANVTSVFVTMNFSSSFLGDYILNLQAPNGNILNLSNLEGIHGIGSFTNTVISSAAGTPLSSGSSPFTATFAADAVNGVGPAGSLSNVTSWASLYSLLNGSWTLQAYNNTIFTNSPTTLVSWSIAITYNLPTVTWSPVTDLYTNSAGTTAYAGSNTTTVFENPSATSAITYTVTANNNGCLNTATTTVTVNPLPTTAAFNSGAACAGTDVTLDANAAGAATYSWHGPASFTSTEVTPVLSSVTSGMAGTYTVTVTNAGGCSATSTTTVTVNALPTTAATNDGPACTGGAINVNANATGATAYLWNGPASFIATTPIATVNSVTPGSAGIYTVTVINAAGCTAISTTNVVVNTLSVSATNDGPACEHGNVSLSAGESGTATGITYVWNGPAGFTSTDANPPLTGVDATFAGAYTVTAGNTLSGCSATGTTTVVVNPLPANITGITIVCQGANTTLTDASGGGAWSSNMLGVATVGSSTGIVTGISTGTAAITYTLPTGCITSTVVNVYPALAAISGTKTVCIDAITILSDATDGGVWSANNANVSIDGSGNVTGITAGTSVITYTSPAGCFITAVATVNPLPAIITGNNNVCLGLTTTLSDAAIGGVWSSTNTGVATVGATSRIVTGIAAGIDTIIYTLPTGCSNSYSITVNPMTPILNNGPLCVGSTLTLYDTTGTGTWSSSVTTHATAGSASGIIMGVGAGTSAITYTAATGCKTSTTVTVYAAPVAISGGSTVCPGSTISLSDITAGGSWDVDINASIDGSGHVTGITSGPAVVSYTLSTGCMVTKTINVATVPDAISGTTVCAGSTVAITEAVSGGTWSSGNVAIATVGTGTGIVTGVFGGTANISYTTAPGTGCVVSATVTVQALAPIVGNPYICVGGADTLALSDGTHGGTWSSSSSTITIDTNGLVTGISVGTASITYTLPSGCSRSVTLYINPAPSPISGTTSTCIGYTTSLSDDGIGTWSSSYVVTATIGSSSGIVTGATAGTVTITYSTGPGCNVTTTVTVNPNLGTISGPSSVCLGATIALVDTTIGGIWSSSNGNVDIDGSGNVTGMVEGTSTITYMNTTTGCFRTYPMTVKPVPSAIFGITTLCAGGTTTLYDTTLGAISWTSSNTSAATVINSGVVTGVASGTAIITYKVVSGCTNTTVVTVLPPASPVTGGGIICPGTTIALTDASGAGSWSSSNTAVALVSGGGSLTSVAGGTATISYSPSGVSGCGAAIVVTVNAAPAISGNAMVCANGTITLSDASTGGAWSSSNVSVGSVSVGGVVSGQSAGTVAISYTTVGACVISKVITVNPLPSSILGTAKVCLGSITSLSDVTPGGVWASSNGLATVDSFGNVTGAGTGTVTISYAVLGCYATTVVTANTVPTAILGVRAVCAGLTTVLSDGVGGGTWSSTSGATVGSTGIVTGGSSAGTSTISYILSTGCGVAAVVTVNTAPSAILGNTPACIGSIVTLTDVTTGGTWSSSNTAMATIGSSSGILTGVAGGTVTISYINAGCRVTAIATVNAAVANINGPATVCQGATIALTDATTGGTWSSSNTAAGTVGTNGIVSGVSVGITNITYTAPTGCTKSVTITVTAGATPILGATALCQSATTTLSNATVGGTWSLGGSLIATIGGSTGLVTGSGTYSGTATISYTTGGCAATAILTVNPKPKPVQGSTSECSGTNITLTDATAGGAWSVSGNATIVGSTGVLTAGAVGSASVTYTLGTGCSAIYPNSVNPNPAAILGNPVVCVGATTALTDVTPTANSWTSSNATVASAINSGVVTGVAAGTAIITYKILQGGCIATQVVTVNAGPVVLAITGPATISHATPASLSDVTSGGVWSSSNSGIISLTGTTSTTVTATAISTSGTATIRYTVTNGLGCTTTVTMNVTASPAPPHHSTGVATANLSEGTVVLYPNPTFGTINIKADHAGTFSLYSLEGKDLGTYKVNEGITNISLPTGLATGIYMGRYIDGDGNATLFKIVKQ